MIPKTIHLTWKDSKFPYKYKRCVESWVRLNPDHKVMLWTDESFKQFVKDLYPERLDRVCNFSKGIILADYIRLLVVYHYGGVYADVDFECLKPVDEWDLDHDLINVCHEPVEHESVHKIGKIICNALFAAPPQCESFMRMIKRGDEVIDKKSNEVMKSYGPVGWTQIYNKHTQLFNLLDTKQYYPVPDVTSNLIKYQHTPKDQYVEMLKHRNFDSNAIHYWDHSNLDRKSILDLFTTKK